MQGLPPIPSLLQQLEIMASNAQSLLDDSNLDWLWRPAESEWSLTEIACHLRDVEREVHQFRFRALIEKDNVFIPGVSADEWAAAREYRQQDGEQALEDFIRARKDTLALLRPLPAEAWRRQGRHAFLGTTTMQEIVHLAVRHDEIHWDQIKTLLSDQRAQIE